MLRTFEPYEHNLKTEIGSFQFTSCIFFTKVCKLASSHADRISSIEARCKITPTFFTGILAHMFSKFSVYSVINICKKMLLSTQIVCLVPLFHSIPPPFQPHSFFLNAICRNVNDIWRGKICIVTYLRSQNTGLNTSKFFVINRLILISNLRIIVFN